MKVLKFNFLAILLSLFLCVGGSLADTGARIAQSSQFTSLQAQVLAEVFGSATESFIPISDATYDLGSSSKKFRDLYLSRNALVGGTLGVTGVTTLSADLLLNNASPLVKIDSTAKQLVLGSTTGAATNGAIVRANGSTFSGASGFLDLFSGTVAAAKVRVQANGSTASSIDFATNSLGVWSMGGTGSFIQDSSNGADIILSRSGTSVREPAVASVTAAGTTVADATGLTGVYNWVTTAAASTGVKLWDAGVGSRIVTQNFGANNVKLYPASGAQTINGAAAGVGITLAAATDDIATCFKISATQWGCTVGAGPAT